MEYEYDVTRFTIDEDARGFYDNLDEVLSMWPSADEFEKGSEWNWSADCVDEDGDSYHWLIQCWYDYGRPSVEAYLQRLYIGSGSPQKNPTHNVMSISYTLDENEGYPSDYYDDLCEVLVEMIRQNLEG